VNAPSTSIPPSKLARPVTSTVLNVVFPVTPNVPATAVLPVADCTVNLFVLTSKFPSTPRAPVTSKLLPTEASVVTVKSLSDSYVCWKSYGDSLSACYGFYFVGSPCDG